MEVIDCGNETNKQDSCNVCIVNDFKFRAVNATSIVEKQLDFCEWWPTAARILISGLFGDSDSRRSAAKALLTLTEFEQTGVRELGAFDSIDATALKEL